MDRHHAMHCFCRVVETGSFAAAARDLDVTRSVVTRTIQELEAWTASRLLERTTRTMQLTEAGDRFYAYCRRVLQDTEQTLSAMRSARAGLAGRITVSTPVSLTLSFLSDHLLAFQAAHPALELDLRLSDKPVDLVREGVDLALRGRAALEDSSLVAVPLMTLPRLVCASPGYWQRHARPEHPQALVQHDCLSYVLGSDASRWEFDGPDGHHAVDVRGRLRSDNSLLLIDALRQGLGVGLVPEPMARRALAAGELELALGDYRAEPRTLYAVYPSRDHLPERVRALVRFLKERLPAPAVG
ncbi:LysR family transcriptional regulator [Pseudaquabacterium pictum]|uniref:Transcriptional regulator n=1 Tax=Pseudaquabacterium pictum TaxID=2315236 RepID=A0A480AY25_9BURK|nr:LysR family transcriptional regulator [Rubrivivax pictus]GCL63688.1 transcriptional regulator [Rubrivivax pictus]